MKKLLSGIAFVFAATCLTSSMALASTTCPFGGYDQYSPQNVGVLSGSITCATNNLTFSNFQFSSGSSGGASKPTPASITVTPQQTPGDEGFSFNPGFIVGANQHQDATIKFAVTAAPGALLDDLYIFFNGAKNGTGSAAFSETYCTVSFTSGCQIFSVDNTTSLDMHIFITPTTKLYITKDFGVTGGTEGSANLSTVQNNYSSTVPEPATLSLMGLGLVGLGLIARRRKV